MKLSHKKILKIYRIYEWKIKYNNQGFIAEKEYEINFARSQNDKKFVLYIGHYDLLIQDRVIRFVIQFLGSIGS